MSMILVISKLTPLSLLLLTGHPDLSEAIAQLASTQCFINQYTAAEKYSKQNNQSSSAQIENAKNELLAENEKLEKDLMSRNIENMDILIKDVTSSALSFEKDWHGIHYLLSGTDWDTTTILGQAVLGGQEIGEDIAYGPARVLTAEQVQEIVKAVDEKTEVAIASNYDAQKMNELKIYPGGWDLEDNREILLDSLKEFMKYYQDAAKGNCGILLMLM